MTESPKPISPGQTDPRHRIGHGVHDSTSLGGRSPNPTHQLHPSQYAGGAGRGASPIGLPPPSINNSNAPHLPSLPGLNPSDVRMPMPNKLSGSQSGSINNVQHHPSALHQQAQGPANASNPSSLSSHSHAPSSGGSMRDIVGNRETDLWTYVRDMESRMTRMQDDYEARINRLQDEVNSLKGQLQHQGR